MKKEAENLIRSYIYKIKEGISDKKTYEHIIASVLEIYTKSLPYSHMLNQILSEVDGIKENGELFNCICLIAESLDGFNKGINIVYAQELLQDKEEWEYTIAGEVHDFIYR